MEKTFHYIGHGIYTIPEASRLTKIPSRVINRWIKGYKYKKNNTTKTLPPLFSNDYAIIDEKISLSFLDLIEIRFINAFREHGVSWQSIKIASKNAAKLLQFTHPFSLRKIYTDGKYIITKIANEENVEDLLNLVDTQYEIEEILSSLLREGLDFSEMDIASKWWPLGKSHSIVIDPERNLGKPIIDKYNITTHVIYQTFKTVNSLDEVASWYEIDKKYVQEAVEYESSLVA